ncbi:Lrp/AsnC family transcriptional regulator [Priestia koreensis]|uniref:AsnC family transcriptional regulator n=1 Tax=Priestia koreensis TaxID=284581 RepID=A0A0M0KX79_9BACI|nr:Lrp/AsnC family transcriptional regulator [Priestia koreensis]KOO42978.1 AsnC family transcriptional regulator [Priestia koreensis]
MDRIDIDLLELLQVNSRMTVSELSKKLALSRPSVTERLHRLQEKGIIEEFTARVSPAAIGRETLLIIQVTELKVSHHEFENTMMQDLDIIECHRVTGEVSYVMKAAVTGMGGLRVLVDRLIPYGNINTSIILTSPVPYRHLVPKVEIE